MKAAPHACLAEVRRGLRLAVRVQPRSGRRGVVGLRGDQLRIALHSAPEKGKANRELLALLSELLDFPAGRLRLVHGESSRDKVLEIESALPEERERIRAALARLLAGVENS